MRLLVKIRSAEEVKFEALDGEVAEGAVKKLKVCLIGLSICTRVFTLKSSG